MKYRTKDLDYYKMKRMLQEHLDFLSSRAESLTRKFISDHREVSRYDDIKYYIAFDSELGVFYVAAAPDNRTDPLRTYCRDKEVLYRALDYFGELYRAFIFFNDIYSTVGNSSAFLTESRIEKIINDIERSKYELTKEEYNEEDIDYDLAMEYAEMHEDERKI